MRYTSLRKGLAFLLACTMLCGTAPVRLPADAEQTGQSVRGLFVNTLNSRDFPSASGLKGSEIEAQAAAVVRLAEEGGFNAIFLEVDRKAIRFTAPESFRRAVFWWRSRAILP
jgi:uncharacterized lipoprotein YddW (UPF0748 family)